MELDLPVGFPLTTVGFPLTTYHLYFQEKRFSANYFDYQKQFHNFSFGKYAFHKLSKVDSLSLINKK